MEPPPFQHLLQRLPQPPPFPPPPPPKKAQGFGGWIAAAFLVIAKFKVLLIALKTGGSMFLSIAVYSWAFGWPFAIGFVLLIFVHEMGHVIAARAYGLPVSAPMFIPFLGAFITLKEHPRDAWTEAVIGYGGPLAGCIGSWICFAAGVQLHSHLLIAVASSSFWINMFNLIPVPPLDGGRICAAVSPWFWFPGLVLLGLAAIFLMKTLSLGIILAIVLLAALPRLKETFFAPPTPALQAYYATHISNRLTMALMYAGLAAALTLGMMHAHPYLSYLWDAS